ncbi:MAG: ribosome silencing factor [Kofleriaceae bacterium]|jgi:ribosome-associated protein|nr:ribosome silencing factor [Kofleriaceae bacterium]MBP9167784.1 ribosome silencing factor [Kofleriaceae bacterium]MBP9857719.1 ribosome silencing factor [Kofleriaceae bacterium]
MSERPGKSRGARPATDPRPARAQGDDDAAPTAPRTDDAGLADALRALDLALDKKAVEPMLLDVRGLCTYASYQLVVSGRSERQVDAISEGIVVGMRDAGVRALSTEGKRSGQWALLDFGDLIVHVFHHPAREHYDLEGLWIDAPRVPIEVPTEARVPAGEY